ncbi:hypothetical protein ACFPRL_36525 [Pseudoclavibacter helvolus]
MLGGHVGSLCNSRVSAPSARCGGVHSECGRGLDGAGENVPHWIRELTCSRHGANWGG